MKPVYFDLLRVNCHIIVALLDAEGIYATIGPGDLLLEIPGETAGMPTVWVRDGDYDRALALVQGVDGAQADPRQTPGPRRSESPARRRTPQRPVGKTRLLGHLGGSCSYPTPIPVALSLANRD